MPIDKTTGKGCGQSIVSTVIAKRLAEDGIVGKIISKTQMRNGEHYLLQVKSMGNSGLCLLWVHSSMLTDETLWTPSFIDKEKWERAVRKFRDMEDLSSVIEKHLLPEMDEEIQSISDERLASLTKKFLIEKGVLNTPIAQRSGETYYFNEYEVYSHDKEKRFQYEKGLKTNTFQVYCGPCFNNRVWFKAISRFEVGMSLDECIRVFMATRLTFHAKKDPSPIERLVQNIPAPVYEHFPENKNKNTFDYVRMAVGLSRYQYETWEDLRAAVKKYRRKIYKRVFQKLDESFQHNRYGVPISFLKLSDVTLRRDYTMEFIFELKLQEEMAEEEKLT